MLEFVKFKDFLQIQPPKALTDLTKVEKHKLMDSLIQKPTEDSKRGLLVTLNLSSSARRINNRIYTPKGQMAGLDSWTQPYGAPLIKHHDQESGEPLGRTREVRYVSKESDALRFFKTGRDYSALVDAFDRNDAQKIYKLLKKNQLLMNKNWLGLGELEADVAVFDEDAIEKFLDGRYMTFSAGTHTDSYTCGICGSNWATGDICDHRPGIMTDEGDIGTFVTGIFYGDEISIANLPANKISVAKSMRFLTDSVPADCLGDEQDSDSVDFISMTDAKYSNIDFDKLDITDNSEKPLPNQRVEMGPKNKEDEVQLDSTEETQQDSVDEVVNKETETKITDTEPVVEETKDEETSIDWELIDLVFTGELSKRVAKDETLSDSALIDCEALEDSVFCGADRKLPLVDKLHVEVAKSILDKLKLDDNAKSVVLKAIEDRETKILTDLKANCECKTLKEDLAQALLTVDSLKEKLNSLEKKLEDSNTLDVNIPQDSKESDKISQIDRVDNPSGSHTDPIKKTDSLSNYEKNIINKYKQIRDSEGAECAEAYIVNLKRKKYLANDFDHKTLMES